MQAIDDGLSADPRERAVQQQLGVKPKPMSGISTGQDIRQLPSASGGPLSRAMSSTNIGIGAGMNFSPIGSQTAAINPLASNLPVQANQNVSDVASGGPDISKGLTTGFEAGKGTPIYVQRGQSGEMSFSDQGGNGAKAYIPGSISAGRPQTQAIGDGLSADPRERAVQEQLGVQPRMNSGGGGMLSVMPSRSVKDYQGDLAAMQSLTATRAQATDLRDGITQPMGGSSGMSPAQRAAEKAYEIADLEIGSGTAYGSLGYSPSNRGSQQRAATRRLVAGQKLATDLAGIENNQAQNQLAAAKLGMEGRLMEQKIAQGGKLPEESFGNPVDEVDESGNPVRTLYGNRGTRRIVEGAKPVPKTGGGISVGPDGTMNFNATGAPKLTEQQSKDLVYHTRGSAALKNMDGHSSELADPAKKVMSGLPLVGNKLAGAEYQQAEQGGREFLASILRKDSGAAITKDEMDVYGKTYLPQPFDAPDTLKQKAGARQQALDAIQLGLGPARQLVPENGGQQATGQPQPGSGGKDYSSLWR